MSKNGKNFNDTFFLSFFVLHFCFASAHSTPAAAVFGIMLPGEAFTCQDLSHYLL